MVIGVDCPRAVSEGGRVTTGVEDITNNATTGTTISKQRMRKKVRIVEIQNSTRESLAN
jgi:hypothetical protein